MNRRRALVCVVVALVVIAVAGVIVRRQLFSGRRVATDYDISKAFTLRGKMLRLQYPGGSPHAYLLVEVDDADGLQRWAVEGNSPKALADAGWSIRPGSGPVKPGDVVAITAFPLRPTADQIAIVSPNVPEVLELAKEGRLVHGVDITLSDDRKLAFGSAE